MFPFSEPEPAPDPAAAQERVDAKRTARVMRRQLMRAALDKLAVALPPALPGAPVLVTFQRERLYDALEAAVEAVEHAHQLIASSAFLVVGESLLVAGRLERTRNGVPYRWGLAGPEGGWYVLCPVRGQHTHADVQEARRQLHNDQDVRSCKVEWQEPSATPLSAEELRANPARFGLTALGAEKLGAWLLRRRP